MTTQYDPLPSLDELGRADAVAALHGDPDRMMSYVQCPCGFEASSYDPEEKPAGLRRPRLRLARRCRERERPPHVVARVAVPDRDGTRVLRRCCHHR